MYLYSIYLGPKAAIWEPLYGPSIDYIGTWTLRDTKPSIRAYRKVRDRSMVDGLGVECCQNAARGPTYSRFGF